MQRARDAEDAQKNMIGMSREEIFTCMGIPSRKAIQDKTEIWAYKSGNNYTDKNRVSTRAGLRSSHREDDWTDSISESLGFGNTVTEKRYCQIQVVFKEDRVSAVHYSGPTGGLWSDDEQCAFATRNCRPQ